MDLMEDMRGRARANVQRVAFFEGENPTMIRAVAELAGQGLASCVVVGNAEAVRRNAEAQGVSLEGVELVDLADAEANEAFAQRYEALPSCPWKPKGVRRRVARPMERALMMQALGDVDITFGGIDCPTGDVILGGQTIVGLADGIDTVSSMGIFDIPGYEGPDGQLLGFGDSAVCQDPTPEQEASIAIAACETWEALTGREARCALLSFSTDGSGAGDMVQKVRDARDIANQRRPDLKIDGEFQLDAALRPAVAAHKVHRQSEVAGRANVIIWPDLNVGNVGVKLVQMFGHANAYGPMLQGFKKVVCDCSRSAPVSEIVGNVVMSCVRAQALAARGEK
jgi:phosphate acetyltransferase